MPKRCYREGEHVAKRTDFTQKAIISRTLVTLLLKVVLSREGADVHDSAGLDQAVALCLTATLLASLRLKRLILHDETALL